MFFLKSVSIVFLVRSVRDANDVCAMKRIPHRQSQEPIELLREEGMKIDFFCCIFRFFFVDFLKIFVFSNK